MLFAFKLEHHERAGHRLPVFGVLGKFDLEPVDLRHGEKLGYPELIVHLREHEEVLGQHFGCTPALWMIDDEGQARKRWWL